MAVTEQRPLPSTVAPLLLTTWYSLSLSSLRLPGTSVKISHLLGRTFKYHTFFLVDISCFLGLEYLKKSCPSLKQHFFEIREVPPSLSPLSLVL